MGWDWSRKREKNFRPELRSYSTSGRKFRKKYQENFEKNLKKIRKLKNPFPALFLAKMGCDRPWKREKNFRPEFRSYSTRGRKFQKK